MTIAFVTSCTHTRTEEAKAKVSDMPFGLTIQEGLEQWINLLSKHEPATTARELYRGIGFQTVIKIQEAFKPNVIKIVTGGQGLIDIDERIVPYDFSADVKERHHIQQHVTKEPFIQPVWWQKINRSLRNTEHPVANLIEGHDLTVISLGKVFLRYCASDILEVASRFPEKVRILLSGSSVGSVPAQLRSYIIPFDRGVIEHIPGNRNDGQHRAAYLFFQLLNEDPEFGSLPITDQRVHFMDDVEGSKTVDIEALIDERPHLLKMDPEAAYRALRREMGTLGGRMKFRSAFRKLQGVGGIIDQGAVNDAANILKEMDFLKSAPAQEGDDEEQAITGVMIFIEALREVAPDSQFTANQVSEWAKKYYTSVRKEVTPSFLESPQRLVFLLKANLGVLKIKDNGKSFSLTNVNLTS